MACIVIVIKLFACSRLCLQMSFPIERAVMSGAVKAEEIPETMKEYLARIQERNSYKEASAKLG